MFRIIQILFNNVNQLNEIHKQELIYKKKLIEYNIKIYYTKSKFFKIILNGYDNKIKFISSKIKDFPNTIFKKIENMPMFKYQTNYNNLNNKKIINYLCGIKGFDVTNHCFNDLTHQTCCLLGPKARKYAEKSGNTIGKISEKNFEDFYGFKPTNNTLTPWCTCIGSEVCSYYKNKFNDGTHIKFINNKKNNIPVYSSNENYTKKKFNYPTHRTPGIIN